MKAEPAYLPPRPIPEKNMLSALLKFTFCGLKAVGLRLCLFLTPTCSRFWAKTMRH